MATEQWLGNVPSNTMDLPPQDNESEEYETQLEAARETIRELNEALHNGLETSQLIESELERQIAARDHTIQAMERENALFKGIVISTIKDLSELLPPEKKKPISSMSASAKQVAINLQEVEEAILKEYAL